jgi:DNA-binding response OmpR family regulator
MKKIVVVEDQQVLATIYKTKLVAEGFDVEVAVDGLAGLDLIKRVKPELVLLDLMMPGRNGLEVLKELRETADFGDLPVIIFTGSAGASRTSEAWQAGATMVLSKASHSPKQLIESIKQAIASAAKPNSTDNQDSRQVVETEMRARTSATVLLVEDNRDTSAVLSLILDRAGHSVRGVESQSAALKDAALGKFDVLIMSRSTVDGSTLELCRRLREDHPRMPIVMYGCGALTSEQRTALDAGVTRYVATAEELLSLSHTVCAVMRKD